MTKLTEHDRLLLRLDVHWNVAEVNLDLAGKRVEPRLTLPAVP